MAHLLLHGALGSVLQMKPLLDRVGGIAIDLSGHGDLEIPAEGIRFEQFIADTVPLRFAIFTVRSTNLQCGQATQHPETPDREPWRDRPARDALRPRDGHQHRRRLFRR